MNRTKGNCSEHVTTLAYSAKTQKTKRTRTAGLTPKTLVRSLRAVAIAQRKNEGFWCYFDKSGLKGVPNTINQAKLNFTQNVQVETASSRRARTAATDPGPKVAPKTTMTTTNNNEFASDADDTMDEVDGSLYTALISPKFSDDVWDLQRLSYIAAVVTRATSESFFL